MFRLRTLGGVSLEGESGPLSGRSSLRRRLALLALLAASRDRGVPRDKLLAYLWPERDAEHGRHSLSQLLHALRRELGAETITVGVDDLRLNPTHIWTDIGAFEDAIDQGRLEDAVSLYDGPFLDGFFLSDALEFEHWAEAERSRAAAAHASAVESLALSASRRGDHQTSVKMWRRRLVLDPLNSGVTLELMRALAAVGDRAGAIQQGRLHASLLQQELGVATDADVEMLIEQLKTEAPRKPVRIDSLTNPGGNGAPYERGHTPALGAPDETGVRVIADAPSVSDATSEADSAADSRHARWREPWSAILPGRKGRIAAAMIVVAIVTAAIARPFQHALGLGRRAPRTIVVGAVRGTDKALALAVGEALRAELEAAPGLRVASDSRIGAALRLMKLERDTAIADSLAVELAARLGAPFAVTATAEPLGLGAEIVVRLIDSRDGSTISTLSEHPASPEEIVPAVTRLSQSLRERALNIHVSDSVAALPAVTTGSITALRDYALARQAVARGDNERAISYAEAAVVEDSSFALAHYLLGDLLWYSDHQHHSEEHLERAFALCDRLPPRERLIVRARYEQLIRDRPDSALAYWKLLRTAYPDEPRAYEGISWVYTALGQGMQAQAVEDTAFALDTTVGLRGVRAHIGSLIAAGDTASALSFAASKSMDMLFGTRYNLVLAHRDWNKVLLLLDSAAAFGVTPGEAAARRQVANLALGRLADGGRDLESVRADPRVQNLPRALLLQARAEVTEGSRTHATALGREAFEWLREADLSPPAYARLAERIADVAARTGDGSTIAAVRHFIVTQDAGRNLRSYSLALMTIDAFAAFARGDMRTALSLAQRTSGPMFYGRAVSITMQLRADASAALGDRKTADSLYRVLADPSSPVIDGDNETFEVVRRAAAGALAAHR